MFGDLSKVRALVLSPHADDAEFGMGGLIHRILKAGGSVHVSVMTFVHGDHKKINMVTGEYETYSGADRAKELELALEELSKETSGIATKSLVTEDTTKPNKYHHRLDTFGQGFVMNLIEGEIKHFSPTDIFIPVNFTDQDHRIVNKAARACIRPQFFSGNLWEFETGGERSFLPNLFVALTEEELKVKLKSVAQYKSQSSGSELYVCSPESHDIYARRYGRFIASPAAEGFYLVRGRLN